MPVNPPKTANQLRLFKKAEERKKIKAYMLPADQYNDMNLGYAQRILAKHAQGADLRPFWILYAREVMKRLRPNDTSGN